MKEKGKKKEKPKELPQIRENWQDTTTEFDMVSLSRS